MAKRKSNRKQEMIQEFIDVKFPKNTLRVYPFPPGMYDAITSNILAQHPDPEVPKIKVASFAGSDEDEEKMEEMDDYDDPEFVKARDEITKVRETALAEVILEFILEECIEVIDTKKMKSDIKRLSKFVTYPDDEIEALSMYVTTYLLSTEVDYSKIITTSLKMTVAGNKEVGERLDSFQDRVQRGELDDGSSPSVETKE